MEEERSSLDEIPHGDKVFPLEAAPLLSTGRADRQTKALEKRWSKNHPNRRCMDPCARSTSPICAGGEREREKKDWPDGGGSVVGVARAGWGLSARNRARTTRRVMLVLAVVVVRRNDVDDVDAEGAADAVHLIGGSSSRAGGRGGGNRSGVRTRGRRARVARG